jgi:hypothetical protein
MMQARENSSYVGAWKWDRDAAGVIDVAHHAGVQPVGLRMMDRWRWGESNGDSFLIPGPVLDPNRRPQKSEGFPNLVFQKTLVGEVELHCAVGEEHKSWRGD